ncbi:Pre-rRNA-processing protein ESF2 [Linum perenne]
MDDDGLEPNLLNSKADGDLNPRESRSSNRLKSKKKKQTQEVEFMEGEKHVNGDNIGEEVDVEGSRSRLKSGNKKKKQFRLLQETEGNDKEENVLDGEPAAEPVREVLEESNPEPIRDVTTDSISNEQQLLVDEKKKRKRKERLLEGAAKAGRLGICYLSRIPPHMDHVSLRHILSQYGEIQRIYLVPEDSNPLAAQRKAAKHKRQSFSEGWVEFSDKSVAKRVANMLNGQQMGGKKRSKYYFDMWNIKYLSKFKWDDLTEETAIKRATREQKVALELHAAKRERDFYLKKVESSIALSNIEERLKKKQKVLDPPKNIRRFQQKKPVSDKTKENKSNISRDFLTEVFAG